MAYRTRKTAYATALVLGIAVLGFVLVRTTYDSGFLALDPAPVSELSSESVPATSLALVRSFESVAPSNDTLPAPSAVVAITPKAEQNSFAISIPAIGVDAHIEDVGIKASTGNIDTPRKLANAAWYQKSAVPGEKGTAVLLGHVDNGLGLSGVFKRLHELKAGDDIFITTKDGSKVHFVVTNVADYELVTAPVRDILHDPDDPVALHIITCGKTFYGGRFHYDHRIVVSAVPA